MPEIETLHLWSAIAGLLGILGCWKIAHFLLGYRAAFWTALLLSITPSYYGHMFANPKDIPFAAAYIWTIYYLVRIIPTLSKVPWSLSLRFGLALGATLGIRFGALVLIFYLALACAVYLINSLWKSRSIRKMMSEAWIICYRLVAPALPVAWVIKTCRLASPSTGLRIGTCHRSRPTSV